MNNSGYIYCLHHQSFLSYGPNVFKLGHTNNLKRRLSNYKTSFVSEPYFVHTNFIVNDRIKAEYILFILLNHYRITNKREFFSCPIEYIIYMMDRVANYFNTFSFTDKIIYDDNSTDILMKYADDEIDMIYMNKY